MRQTKSNNCIMCRGPVGKTDKIIYNSAWAPCCPECQEVFINPNKFNFIEDETKTRYCSKCKEKHPSNLRFFAFNKYKKRWAYSCTRTELWPAKVIIPKKVPIIFSGNHNKDILMSREKDWLEKLYMRLFKRNQRLGGKIKTIPLRIIIERYLNSERSCGITGLELNTRPDDPQSISAIRKNDTLGYTITNTILCCRFVEIAKGPWTLKEIQELWAYLPKD